MQRFNLIMLSLLFMLSVTAAAPWKPEQALVKRDSAIQAEDDCAIKSNIIHVHCSGVSVDFVYAYRIDPTELVGLISIVHITANKIYLAHRRRNYLLLHK
jgi:hypothetical protein